ncbi:TPA: hypothetical protein ACP2OC_004108 [Escherichia coli]
MISALVKRYWLQLLVLALIGALAFFVNHYRDNAITYRDQRDKATEKLLLAMGEELQHRYAIKETRSKLKGTIGSRLMNERKKEKRVLELEHEHIMQVTQPELLIG